MAQRVIIPRMGQTMTEGNVARWFVADGDAVEAGDDIYELEYDKATAVVKAKKAGIVRLLVEEGATVPLGEAVAIILEEGETLESVHTAGEHVVANAAKGGAKPVKENTRQTAQTEAQADTAILRAPRATPIAKRLAKEMGVDISKVIPADGLRIMREDVLRYANSGKEVAEPAMIRTDGTNSVPLRGMRKVVAQRMTESYFTYPAVTLTTDANMYELLKMRKELNEELAPQGVKLSVTDMLIKAVAKALRENKIINTSLFGDAIVFHDAIHIGVAVALEDGLVVPVVRHADKLKLQEISACLKRLAELAKTGALPADDMRGGTFTITNLGGVGIDSFNPIINAPQSAILGVGRTVEKAVPVNGEITVQPRTVLSITHDHRVIDGVPAGRFLQSVVRFIEKPFLLLMD